MTESAGTRHLETEGYTSDSGSRGCDPELNDSAASQSSLRKRHHLDSVRLGQDEAQFLVDSIMDLTKTAQQISSVRAQKQLNAKLLSCILW